MKQLILIAVAVLLTGCATPFADFYTDQTNGQNPATSPVVILPMGDPKIIRGRNQEEDSLKMAEDGYALLGHSLFNSGNADESEAIRQGRKVHAAVILLYAEYTGTVSGSMPLTLPNTQTSTTSFTGNAYGPGGYSSLYGTANTTTYGTKTTYVPYAVHRSNYLATYWIKLKPPIFGVRAVDLTDEARRAIGSNKGVLVYAVAKGSPAFDADIFRGDIVRSIGDLPVYDDDSLGAALTAVEGKDANVVIHRDGKDIIKPVKFRMANYAGKGLPKK